MAVELIVGGWFAQPFIKYLVDKAIDKAIQPFAESWGFTEDMENLRISLLKTQTILDEVQISRSNKTKWEPLMKELKDAAYDAEDLIDEFQYHVLRQKIKGEEEDKASGSTTGLPNIFAAAKKKLFGSSYDMGSRVKEIQGRLEKFANTAKDIMQVLPPNDRGKQLEVKFQVRESCSSPVTDILFGRDRELNQVVDWLLGSANQVEPASGTFSVLAIEGIGGVGKTTLTQYVYKDDKVQDHFDLKIWVCVSDNFTVQRLTKSTIESITLKKKYDNMELEALQKILHQHITKKKFLLVLDDVWSDNKSIWETFCSLLKVGAHGSKIIVTTRDMKVSKMVSRVEPILLDGLEGYFFWELFKKCSFGTLNPEEYPELQDIGRKIASKLEGSPLAAKTLGSVLQSDLSQQHWTTVMKSDIWKVKQDECGIMPALELSYQYLNENLKQCFAFCSLFPKDYEFNKTELVQMWMAEGFIEDKNTKRMEDVGSDYFLEFVNRSFFQKSRYNEFRYNEVEDESEIGFLMHDLIHDLAEMISAEETCRIENNRQIKTLSTVRHLRVVEVKLPLEFFGYNKLRTLVVLKNSPPDSLFEKLRSIRVLDVRLGGFQKLSEHIGKLIHLRYLDLSYNYEIEILPDSLCDLYNLQTLKVEVCSKLKTIPRELDKLANLRHIVADDRFWVTIKNVRRLTNLQEWPRPFRIQKDDGLKLGQLKDLTQLHGTLRIENLENVVDSKEAQLAELKNKVHLKELELVWYFNWNIDENDAKLEEEVIEGLQPHDSLKILKIEGYNGGRSPSWLMPKVLSNLKKLELVNCKGWDDVLPFIGQRLHLIELRMVNMPALKQLSHEFEGKCFPKLKVLKLYNLPALEEWSWTEGEDLFPCMRELRVSYCPKLKRLPPFPPSLKILRIINCPSLILNSKTEDDEEGSRHLPPSLKELELTTCGEYAKLLADCLHNLHSVTRLEISDCPCITSIPQAQLVKLKYLYISSCDELIRMECLGLFKSLKELKIVGCPKLVQLDVEDEKAGSLSSLRKLCVDNTALLKMFPLRNSLSYIRELTIESSSEEVIFEEAILVRRLTAVTSLRFSYCEKLQSLPTELLHCLPLLKYLMMYDCPQLRSLPSFSSSLRKLKIINCPQIQSLPEKGLPPLLQLLDISDCPQIQAMPEAGLPMSLDIFYCTGKVHPTLKEQSEKFYADRETRREASGSAASLFPEFLEPLDGSYVPCDSIPTGWTIYGPPTFPRQF
ncbi:putative disease resistance protein RGA4 isoform X1 [Zingiber officinale]|uniref:putative disease resistance protein RGA4 isoform X1 n=1 Tax=Zingiber officinale TaxID=94328 RepID=UPI001C4D4CDC|nr:putative disease resistance protein RGA4 isoform X1 [Zingiber officinale]XP_042428613.1 putative disease resistance protein RGA4 isoform X1 [Zingiber officinale]